MAKVTNHELFSQAKKFIPGGVNSPVRSFAAVGGEPVFIKQAKGPYLYGEDGQRYIDYCLSWGALILGHANDAVIKQLKQTVLGGTSFGAVTQGETELARIISEAVPSCQQVRLVSSGTEAVMSAIRLARAYTHKTKLLKFSGAYHGHADYLLAKAGSGLATLGIPTSEGVPFDFTKHTLVVDYNNLAAVEQTAERHQKDLAGIIVEPVAANCGVIPPKPEFLPGLRKIADQYGLVLIFDEVITGFRLSLGGAQEFFGVKPDLTCLGKIMGGGLPIAAFGGKKKIMKSLAPLGRVYQAGTLSGNPLSVAAGIITLKQLKKVNLYQQLAKKTEKLCAPMQLIAKMYQPDLSVNYFSSLFSLSAKTKDLPLFKKVYQGLLAEGIYLSPSAFEANFLSTVHSWEIIEKTLAVFKKVLKKLS